MFGLRFAQIKSTTRPTFSFTKLQPPSTFVKPLHRTFTKLEQEKRTWFLPPLEFTPHAVKYTTNGIINKEIAKVNSEVEQEIMKTVDANPEKYEVIGWAVGNSSRLAKIGKYKISETLFVHLLQSLAKFDMPALDRKIQTKKLKKRYFGQLQTFREDPTEIVLNSLACAFGANWDVGNVLGIRKEIELHELKHSVENYEGLINGLKERGQMDKAESYFEKMKAEGATPSVKIYSSLLDGYSRQNKLEKLLMLYHLMKNSNVYSIEPYNHLIAAYAKRGDWHRALQFFDELKVTYHPDASTFGALLTLVINTNKLTLADDIIQEAEYNKIPRVAEYLVPLVGLHTTKGDMPTAIKIFEEMTADDAPIQAYYYIAKGYLAKQDEKNAAKWIGLLKEKFGESNTEQVNKYMEELEPKSE